MTTEQAFAQAIQHHQARRFKEAEALYHQILAAQPNHAEAWHYMGVLADHLGRPDRAIEWIRHALVLNPNNPAAHSNLGEAYRANGQLDEAIASYRCALALKPDLSKTHTNLGETLRERGQLDESINSYRRALAIQPNDWEALNCLGAALAEDDDFEGAVNTYREALEIKPEQPEAHYNLGVALRKAGHRAESMAALQRAITLRPEYAEAHNNLGIALGELCQYAEAADAYRRALAIRPDYAEAQNNLANALKDLGRNEEAVAAYERALEIRPTYAEAWSNFGNLRRNQGQWEQAEACYRRALELSPDSADAHLNLSLLLLLVGRFEEGWREYEWRWRSSSQGCIERKFRVPQWEGEPCVGQSILLHTEQGLGDSIQFIRYVPMIAAMGARVIVGCQKGMKTLLASAPGVSEIFEEDEPWPAFDLHCPMMSLPMKFGTRLQSIPATIPYLHADAGKVTQWRERLEQAICTATPVESSFFSPLKIGVAWAGGTRPEKPDANALDRRRSLRLSQFEPLAAVPGVVFVSLQKGTPAAQAKDAARGMTLLDWTDELHDFADTAALVEALDLVICVDTSIAHLAGALGKPVWVLNRFDICWRWLLDREDSPWYPTMRLFRQPAPGDWNSVMERVARELSVLRSQNSGLV